MLPHYADLVVDLNLFIFGIVMVDLYDLVMSWVVYFANV
jgi:hypothetical protein